METVGGSSMPYGTLPTDCSRRVAVDSRSKTAAVSGTARAEGSFGRSDSLRRAALAAVVAGERLYTDAD